MDTQKIQSVRPVGGFTLELVFDDGHLYQLDFKPLIKSRRDPLHLPLLNVPTFKKVFCNGLTIEWPTGLDICPDALRRWCEAGKIIQEDMLSIA